MTLTDDSPRVIVVIQARLGSTRYPRKVLMPLRGATVLEHIYRRCQSSRMAKEVIVACPPTDSEVIFSTTGILPYEGPEEDVLTRLIGAGKKKMADFLVRVTADCPLVDPKMIDEMAELALKRITPIVTNTYTRTWPDGMDLEVYDFEWMQNLDEWIKPIADRGDFYMWCLERLPPRTFTQLQSARSLNHYRLTLDYAEDMDVISEVYKAQRGAIWFTDTIVKFLDHNPRIARINAMHAKKNQGEGRSCS